ncbi:hypothetical protein M0R72_04745 [Candidatus Pacearchaeota archaeon]|jgi:hypothetical protein|nr:hypothetical protein [Candidatus Pacearchaeota archaeon]
MRGETKLIALFLVLILIPFALSYDIDGDGIDDGEQNMCGDTFCQLGEDVTSCPEDCTNPATPSSGDLTEIPTENETLSPETNQTIPITEENLQSETENSFFVSTTFKIIILASGLIVIGLIIFFIIRKKRNQEDNQTPTTEVAVQQ